MKRMRHGSLSKYDTINWIRRTKATSGVYLINEYLYLDQISKLRVKSKPMVPPIRL